MYLLCPHCVRMFPPPEHDAGRQMPCPLCGKTLTMPAPGEPAPPSDPEAERREALDAVRTLLAYAGEDPDREGLRDTPGRVVRAYAEMFAGYKQRPEDVLKTFEDGACDEMVLLKDIRVWSTCEHHLLPFHGSAHVAYLPAGRIVGLSKLARLVEVYARRLQVQERLTTQVTAALDEFLKPLGSACVVEATHLCMGCRGVRQPGARMVTSSLTGAFRQPEVRLEFFNLVRG